MEPDSTFWETDKPLRIFRKENDLTMEEVATACDCSRTYISHLETGRRIMTLKHARKIAETINVSASALLINHLTSIHRNINNNFHLLKKLIDPPIEPKNGRFIVKGDISLKDRKEGQKENWTEEKVEFETRLQELLLAINTDEHLHYLKNQIIYSNSDKKVSRVHTYFIDFLIHFTEFYGSYTTRLYKQIDKSIIQDVSEETIPEKYLEHKISLMVRAHEKYYSIMSHIPSKNLDEEQKEFTVDAEILDSI